MEAQRKKKIKNKARLPRTAGLRTLSDLTTDLTKAGIDPSRVQERAVMIAKVRAAGGKRKRDEDGMDVDEDGNGDDEDGDNWVSEGDGEDGTRHKRGKANSGAVIAHRKRTPRSNRQLAGMRDEAVRCCHTQHQSPPFTPSLFPFSKCADERSFFFFPFLVANIQSDAITESWTARAQHACESGRERPRYQSQNGAFCICFLFWKFHSGCPLSHSWCRRSMSFFSLCFIFDANMTFILHFYTIFLAETSLRWEAQGRQDQPPIDTPLGTSAVTSIYSISSITLVLCCVVLFPYPFHDIERAHSAFIITRAIIQTI
jgi:hypothetical protein